MTWVRNSPSRDACLRLIVARASASATSLRLIVVTSALTASCALSRPAAMPTPSWCASESAVTGRITACASDETARGAADQAFALLARQLDQQVSVAASRNRLETMTRDAQGHSDVQIAASASDEVHAVARVQMLGAPVEQRAQQGARYYALAVLDLRRGTRQLTNVVEDAISRAETGDIVGALSACRDARVQAHLLPLLFAEVDANVGRCGTLRDAIFDETAIAAVADTVLRITWRSHAVPHVHVMIRRTRGAPATLVGPLSDANGVVRRASPATRVSGGPLAAEIDLQWDDIDADLADRPFRARGTVQTTAPSRTVRLELQPGLSQDDGLRFLAALRREFGDGTSIDSDRQWQLTLTPNLRDETPLSTGEHTAAMTVTWTIVRIADRQHVHEGGVVDQRGIGIESRDARTSAMMRTAARITSALESLLAREDRP